MYVVDIDAKKNQVIIGPKEALYKKHLRASNISWVAGYPPAREFECYVKIRNLHNPAKARINVQENGCFAAVFDEPQMSITAGQSAVLYDGDIVLGGGIIL